MVIRSLISSLALVETGDGARTSTEAVVAFVTNPPAMDDLRAALPVAALGGALVGGACLLCRSDPLSAVVVPALPAKAGSKGTIALVGSGPGTAPRRTARRRLGHLTHALPPQATRGCSRCRRWPRCALPTS